MILILDKISQNENLHYVEVCIKKMQALVIQYWALTLTIFVREIYQSQAKVCRSETNTLLQWISLQV